MPASMIPASMIHPGVLFGAMAVSFLAGLMLGWFGFRPRREIDHLAAYVYQVKRKNPRARVIVDIDPEGNVSVNEPDFEGEADE